MYSWTRLSGSVARDWLDTELDGEFGRKLYIEVPIGSKCFECGTTDLNLSTTNDDSNVQRGTGTMRKKVTAKKTNAKGGNISRGVGATKLEKRV